MCRYSVPWYEFWNPRSGFIGGFITGIILSALITLIGYVNEDLANQLINFIDLYGILGK